MPTKFNPNQSLALGIQAAVGATADLQADRIREELSDHANLLLAIRHFGKERLERYTNNGWSFDVLEEKLEWNIKLLNARIQPKPVLDEEQYLGMEAAWTRDVSKWATESDAAA